MKYIWIVSTDSGGAYMSFDNKPSELDIKKRAKDMLKQDPSNEVLLDWAYSEGEWGYGIFRIPLFSVENKSGQE